MIHFFKGKFGFIKAAVILFALSFVGLVWTISTMGGRLGMSFFFICFLGGMMNMYLFSFAEDRKAS
jgi:hypothetical protein